MDLDDSLDTFHERLVDLRGLLQRFYMCPLCFHVPDTIEDARFIGLRVFCCFCTEHYKIEKAERNPAHAASLANLRQIEKYLKANGIYFRDKVDSEDEDDEPHPVPVPEGEPMDPADLKLEEMRVGPTMTRAHRDIYYQLLNYISKKRVERRLAKCSSKTYVRKLIAGKKPEK